MLPTDPGVHSSLDVLGVAPESGALHEPSQTRSLQQTGDSEGLIVRDAGGLGLQLYVGAGENVIVPGPPSALLSVPNKGEDCLVPRVRRTHVVLVHQRPDLNDRGPFSLAGLDVSELGPCPLQPL